MFGRFKTKREKLQERLSAYIDGRLSAREKERVERLLRESDEARWEMESLRATVALLKRVPMAQPARPLALPEEVRPVSRPALRVPQAALPLATAAAAFLLALVLVGDYLNIFTVQPSRAPETAAVASPVVGEQLAAAPQATASPAPLLTTSATGKYAEEVKVTVVAPTPPSIAMAIPAPTPTPTTAPLPTPAAALSAPRAFGTALAPAGPAGASGAAGPAGKAQPAGDPETPPGTRMPLPTGTPAPRLPSPGPLAPTLTMQDSEKADEAVRPEQPAVGAVATAEEGLRPAQQTQPGLGVAKESRVPWLPLEVGLGTALGLLAIITGLAYTKARRRA